MATPKPAPITGEELKGIAAAALNMYLTMKANNTLDPSEFFIAVWHPGEGLHYMATFVRNLAERLGDDHWLSNPDLKHYAWSFLRFMTPLVLRGEPIAIVTPANMYLPSDKLKAQGRDAVQRVLRAGDMDAHRQAVKDGLMVVEDTLSCVAQTPTLVCTAIQVKPGGGAAPLNPTYTLFPASEFGGAMKLYQTPKPK